MGGGMMFGFSWTTQRKLAKLGEVPEQRIKLEGEAKAHLVEWPSPSSTFHVDLEECLTMRFLWPSGGVLYEGGFEGGQPQVLLITLFDRILLTIGGRQRQSIAPA